MFSSLIFSLFKDNSYFFLFNLIFFHPLYTENEKKLNPNKIFASDSNDSFPLSVLKFPKNVHLMWKFFFSQHENFSNLSRLLSRIFVISNFSLLFVPKLRIKMLVFLMLFRDKRVKYTNFIFYSGIERKLCLLLILSFMTCIPVKCIFYIHRGWR